MGRRRVLPAWLSLVALSLAASASLVPGCGPGDESSDGGGTGGAGGASGGSATGGLGGTSLGGAVPELDDPCSKAGDRACDVGNSKLPLICSEGSWQSAGSCDSAQACDPSTGLCSDVVPECAESDPGDRVCAGGAIAECGPNLVSVEVLAECDGFCTSTGAGPWCVPATCGDTVVDTGEACDDANDDNDDDCTELCRPPFCGDGFAQTGEACDDANDDNDDDCTELCQPPTCGDGLLGPGEDCDEGANNGTAGGYDCPIDCRLRITGLAAGGAFSCARHSSASVKCWGQNDFGQLGLGDTDHRGDERGEMSGSLPEVNLGSGRFAQAIAAGDGHTCALFDDGSVKCWGQNDFGQLGLGDTDHRGDESGEMGGSLPEVYLGSGRLAQAIAVGGHHTCALLDDDSVKCWGQNDSGQLGLGDMDHRGDESGEMGGSLPEVYLGSGRFAQAIAAGAAHTCALLDDDSVKCWGNSDFGQLGLGDTDHRGDESGEMGGSLPEVYLGSGRFAQAIAVGGNHTCALLDDDSVKCWGNSDFGQLGLGETDIRGDESGEMGGSLPEVNLGSGRFATAVVAGFSHTCVLLDDDSVRCWGQNDFGQLGLGDVDHRGDESGEMGGSLPAVDLW